MQRVVPDKSFTTPKVDSTIPKRVQTFGDSVR